MATNKNFLHVKTALKLLSAIINYKTTNGDLDVGR